jgi:hypothetical protein
MTDYDEDAWVACEYIKGRPQTEIAAELGVTSGTVCSRIVRFCSTYRFYVRSHTYGEDRIAAAAEALHQHLKNGRKLTKPSHFSADLTRAHARHEHAWLLRAEGKTLQQIGERLGVSRARAQQMVAKFGRRMKRATRKTHFTLHLTDGRPCPTTIYEQTVSGWLEPGWYIRGLECLGPCDSRDEALDRFHDLPSRLMR